VLLLSALTPEDDQTAGYAQVLVRNGVLTGHVELLTEVEPGSMVPARTVHEAPGFRGQVPLSRCPAVAAVEMSGPGLHWP
jgi:hypothetical protein